MYSSRATRARGQGWRGGRSGGYSSRSSFNRRTSAIERPPSPPLGRLLESINEDDLVAADSLVGSSSPVAITGCEYLASYNWTDKEAPTILIPGAPPMWTPLKEPRALEGDKGNFFRDQNAAHFPSYPLEPAVRALLAETEGAGLLNTQDVDLFACSSTVSSLLCFVRRVDKPFRFLVEVVGDTVFFQRRVNTPKEVIPDVKGFGHTFPEAYTTWESCVKGSSSHQRILKYKFAGVDCVLRYECDGYLPDKVEGDISSTYPSSDGNDDLLALLHGINVSPAVDHSSEPVGPLQVKRAGKRIPQGAVFDLKTRSAWKKDQDVLGEEIHRCWVSQIPNFVLAYHEKGVFNDISVQDVKQQVLDWQTDNQVHLKRLAWLIRHIISTAKERPGQKLEVRCKSLDSVELREQDKGDHEVLPEELKSRWMKGELTANTTAVDDSPTISSSSQYDASDGFGGYRSHLAYDSPLMSDTESEKDYTACSAEECGYCGHCSY